MDEKGIRCTKVVGKKETLEKHKVLILSIQGVAKVNTLLTGQCVVILKEKIPFLLSEIPKKFSYPNEIYTLNCIILL